MLGDPYITSTALAAYLGIPLANSDPSRDAKLDAAVAGASNAVDDHCRRTFNTDGTVSPRVYMPTSAHLIVSDDFYDTDTLIIQKKTLSDTDWGPVWTPMNFELRPMNGIVNGKPWPYRRIVLPYWTCLWAIDRVQVTATWGWPSVPSAVIQATYIIAAQFFKLADAPFGVAGFGAGSDGFSAVKVSDVPQAWHLLCPYILDRVSVH